MSGKKRPKNARRKPRESPVKSLKIGISGVRGVVGDTLTPELLVSFAESFGTYTGSGRVVIGRDTRTSGEMVRYAVTAGLASAGCEALDLGVCPVPTVSLMVRRLEADGGIAITASHNPAEWNALKFFRADGCYLNSHQAQELLDIYHQGDYVRASAGKIRQPRAVSGATDVHADAIIARLGRLPRRWKPTAVIDCVNGAGSTMAAPFLEALGCAAIAIHDEPDGFFPRPPEPLPQNLEKLCAAVRNAGADVGFALDADADRLAIVDEKGRPIGEDFTLAFAVDHILRRTKGTVVVNLSTSHVLDAVAARHGCRLVKTKIGEINVVERMKAERAVIGGEGNGGVIYPEINFTRDAFAAMALTLHYLAQRRMKVSAAAAALPPFRMAKGAVPCPSRAARPLIEFLEKKYEKSEPDLTEGIKIHYGDSWALIRPSNTEPIVRVVTEARTESAAKKLNQRFMREIEEFIETTG
ncbi:MAG: phosphoglucosamine mutase [bacterium]